MGFCGQERLFSPRVESPDSWTWLLDFYYYFFWVPITLYLTLFPSFPIPLTLSNHCKNHCKKVSLAQRKNEFYSQLFSKYIKLVLSKKTKRALHLLRAYCVADTSWFKKYFGPGQGWSMTRCPLYAPGRTTSCDRMSQGLCNPRNMLGKTATDTRLDSYLALHGPRMSVGETWNLVHIWCSGLHNSSRKQKSPEVA